MSDRVDYTGAPAPRQDLHIGMGYNISSSPDEFGVGLFNAIHGLGQAGEEAALKKQHLANSLDHDQRALEASKQLSDAWSDYGKLEGDAAVKGLPAFQDRLKRIYNDTVNGAPNDSMKQMLAQTMYRDTDRYMSHGANYADTQFRHWHEKLHTDAIHHNVNQIVMNRKQPLSVVEDLLEHGSNNIGGADSVREKMKHKLPEGADLNDPAVRASIEGEVEKFRSEALKPTIESLALDGDVKGADKMFQFFKSKLDGEGARQIEAFLAPKLREQWVNDTANQIRPIPNPGGFNPTIAAQAYRDGLMATPSRANAAELGLRPTAAPATGKHASDYFAHLERGNRDVGYIQTNDTHGSHSYGSNGLNTWTHGGDIWGTSAGRFWKRYGQQLGLDGVPGEASGDAAWKRVAAKDPEKLRAAEREWWTKENYDPVQPKLKSLGVQDSVSNDPAVKLYFADRNVQHGLGKMEDHKDRIEHAKVMAGGNPELFLRSMNAQDAAHINGDFHTFLGDIERQSGPAARERAAQGLAGRITGRHETALKAAGEGGAPTAPQAAASLSTQQQQPQPGSPYLTTGAVKSQRRASNLEEAERQSGGDPEKRNALFAELNKRDVLIQSSVADRHQQIAYSLKQLDAMAQKGLPDISLEKVGLNDQMVREAFPPNKQWQAEHLIEEVKYKAQVANELKALEFAPQADVNTYFAEAASGSGVDSFIEHHRKKEGTTGAFSLGADPDAISADAVHRFDLHEQKRALTTQWYERRQKLMMENPAQLVTLEPGVRAKGEALQAAEKTRDPAQIAKAFGEYSSATVAVQRQMGIEDKNIHVLTANVAQAWANDIMKSDDPKGLMMSMEKQHGQHWDQIFHDMATIGGLPTKMVAVQYLDNYNAQVLSNMIKFESGKEKDAAGKKDHRTFEDMIVPTPDEHPGKRAIDNAIAKDPDMEKLKESLTRSGRVSIVNDVQDAVRLLAYGRATGAGGRGAEDHGTASKKAVEAFIANHEFTSDNAMIPKENIEQIKSVMKFVKDSLTNQTTALPGWTATGKSIGVPGQREYLNTAKNLGSWVNTSDGRGVEYRDHTGKPMFYADGQPVRVIFKDMGDSLRRMRSTQYFTGSEGHTRYQDYEPAPYVGYNNGR